jgi:hypothetical protein
MTETSYPWAGEATGDAGPYSDDQWTDLYRALFTRDRSSEGVLRPSDSEGLDDLEVSGVASPVDVASGEAIVDGKFYMNDDVVEVAIPTPTANPRIDRIVLRKDWTSQTVRVTRIEGTESATPSAPAITQTDGSAWDIPLAQVHITTGGVITVTDERVWNRANVSLVVDRGVTINLEAGGAIIPTGLKALVPIPTGMTVRAKGWAICSYLAADATGVQFDIWYEPNPAANGAPDNSDSICNGNEPALASDDYASRDEAGIIADGWSRDMQGPGVMGINLDVNNNCTVIGFTLDLEIR